MFTYRVFSSSWKLAEPDWIPVSNAGAVITYTTVYYDIIPLRPFRAPFTYGVIKLDGATSGITHIIDEFYPGELKMGMRVEAIFKDDRVGNILDIDHFRPV